jgi:hypothetical protein
MKHTVKIVGVTKDGSHGAKAEIELVDKPDAYTIEKIITENGWINATVVLDPKGKLLELHLERWDPTVV